MITRYISGLIVSFLFISLASFSQTSQPLATKSYFLIHSGGNVIGVNTDDRTVIQTLPY